MPSVTKGCKHKLFLDIPNQELSGLKNALGKQKEMMDQEENDVTKEEEEKLDV